MCGIVSIYNKNKKIPLSCVKEMILKGSEAIKHRGFDSVGYYHDESFSVAHNRLSLVGMNNGSQPLFNKDNSIIAVVNGEFYDYKKIKSALIKDGFSFYTESDSEIIIPLYEKYGLTDNFFNKLNGEYAFIIYDKAKNLLIACRDRFGIKPLYYKNQKDKLMFSSEIKSLTAIEKGDWNKESLDSVLSMQYFNHEETLINGIDQIPSGHYIVFNLNSDTFNLCHYESFSINEEQLSLEESISLTRKALFDSVEKRIDNENKIGIALSGGIDSSIIFAIANQISNKKTNAYSISFANSGIYDESSYVKEMALKYNNDVKIIDVYSDSLELMKDAVYHSENVSVNSHLLAKYILFKEMSNDGVKISLSGEGSDELFLGYSHFKLDLNSNIDIKKNKYLEGFQIPDSSAKIDTSDIKNYLGFVPNFLAAKYAIGQKINQHFLKSEVSSKINHKFYSVIKNLDIPLYKNNVYVSSFLWQKLCLTNYILNSLGDKMEMASTIEGRVPFLDKDVFELSKKLPINFKINGDNEKFILKEAFKNDITTSIYQKQKHPFLAPSIMNWKTKNGNNSSFIMDTINSNDFRNNNIFDHKKINNIINLTKNNEIASFDPAIMLVLTLYFFERNFIK